MRLKTKNRSHRNDINRPKCDINNLNKQTKYKTLRLSWKKAFLIKKACNTKVIFILATSYSVYLNITRSLSRVWQLIEMWGKLKISCITLGASTQSRITLLRVIGDICPTLSFLCFLLRSPSHKQLSLFSVSVFTGTKSKHQFQ